MKDIECIAKFVKLTSSNQIIDRYIYVRYCDDGDVYRIPHEQVAVNSKRYLNVYDFLELELELDYTTIHESQHGTTTGLKYKSLQ